MEKETVKERFSGRAIVDSSLVFLRTLETILETWKFSHSNRLEIWLLRSMSSIPQTFVTETFLNQALEIRIYFGILTCLQLESFALAISYVVFFYKKTCYHRKKRFSDLNCRKANYIHCEYNFCPLRPAQRGHSRL